MNESFLLVYYFLLFFLFFLLNRKGSLTKKGGGERVEISGLERSKLVKVTVGLMLVSCVIAVVFYEPTCVDPKYVLKSHNVVYYSLSPFLISGLREPAYYSQMSFEEAQYREQLEEIAKNQGNLGNVDDQKKQNKMEFNKNLPQKSSQNLIIKILKFISPILIATLNIVTLFCFEKSLSLVFPNFTLLFFLMTGITLFIRALLGHIFSRGVGWAYPQFFFSEAIHECNGGLSPILICLTILQTLRPNDFLYNRKSGIDIKIPLWILGIIVTLINNIQGNLFWWHLSGLITSIISIPFLRKLSNQQQNSQHVYNQNSLNKPNYFGIGKKGFYLLLTRVAMIFCLLISFKVFTKGQLYSPTSDDLHYLSDGNDMLLTLVVTTAPRPHGVNHLLPTLTSYVDNLITDPMDPLFGKIHFIVFTQFAAHRIFDQTKNSFANKTATLDFIEWIQGNDNHPPSPKKQRLDFAKAISTATYLQNSKYIGIIEDDFPLCPGKWNEFLRVLYQANIDVPGHCGVFVGTGGSGLIFKSGLASTLVELLKKEDSFDSAHAKDVPADIVIQNCLRGLDPNCSQCSNSLVSSKTLLMHHIGHRTSTAQRTYSEETWQCGWRQPFNGEADVIVV